MSRRDRYAVGSGTPDGWRWITVHEDRPGHPLEQRHILVRADGRVDRVRGRSREARALSALVRDRPAHLVAPATALREHVQRAHESRAATQSLIADWAARRATGARSVRREAARDWDAMHGGVPTVTAAVRRLGGVRLGRDWGKEAREEIPLAARRRHGRTPDELLGELASEYGWRFHSDSALYRALAHRSDARYSREAFIRESLRDYDAEEPYSRLIEDARLALRPARKRRRVSADPARHHATR